MKNFFLKPFLSSHGFSLVQVMIASAVMGIFAVIFMTMMENQAKQTKTTMVDNQISALEATIKSIVTKNSSCDINFEGVSAGVPITELFIGNETTAPVSLTPAATDHIQITSMQLRMGSIDATTGRSNANLEVVISKERNPDTLTKRTTIGPISVTKNFDFPVIRCEQIRLGDPSAASPYFCDSSTTGAKDVCDANCADAIEIATGSRPTSDRCYCDGGPESAGGCADMGGGQMCCAFMVFYNCNNSRPVARCDN